MIHKNRETRVYGMREAIAKVWYEASDRIPIMYDRYKGRNSSLAHALTLRVEQPDQFNELCRILKLPVNKLKMKEAA